MTLENYIARLGMVFNPFPKNAKDVIISTESFREATARLNYLEKTKGFGLITGDSGRGKTTIVRQWSKNLSPSLYKIIYISLTTLTVQDFYRNLAYGIGLEPSYKKTENFRMIQDEITHLCIDKKKTPVIIIDEANYIKNAILNDLKMLFNFEMDSRDRAIVLLTGLPQLNLTLNLSCNEPLRQRIVMNYNIEGMTREEGREYIYGKLKGAGCTNDVFDEAAVEAILNASDGTARVINKYCCTCLMIAAAKELAVIGSDTVMQAVNECELT